MLVSLKCHTCTSLQDQMISFVGVTAYLCILYILMGIQKNKKKNKLNKCTWDSNPHSIKIQFISRSYSRIDYSSDVRLINRFFYQALQIALKKIQILRQLAYKQLDRGEMIPLTSLAKVINYTRRKMLISHIIMLPTLPVHMPEFVTGSDNGWFSW